MEAALSMHQKSSSAAMQQRTWRRIKKSFTRYWQLYLLLIPVIVYLWLFNYVPMYGVQIAFRKFSPRKGITGSPYHRFLDALPGTDFLNHLQINSVICSSLPAHCIKGTFPTADFQKKPCFSKRFSLCSPRTGDVLHCGNVQAHVLYAPNANSQYNSIGDTSLVVRFVYQGKGILITGDMTDSLSEQLLSQYGSHLRSDVVQIANHGWNNCGSVQFYQAVAAQLQLWTNSEYGFQFFRKDEGYQKTLAATAIYHLSTCRQNVFCDQVSMQRFHFPLEAAELQQDV